MRSFISRHRGGVTLIVFAIVFVAILISQSNQTLE
jgi:hypothetical protein